MRQSTNPAGVNWRAARSRASKRRQTLLVKHETGGARNPRHAWSFRTVENGASGATDADQSGLVMQHIAAMLPAGNWGRARSIWCRGRVSRNEDWLANGPGTEFLAASGCHVGFALCLAAVAFRL